MQIVRPRERERERIRCISNKKWSRNNSSINELDTSSSSSKAKANKKGKKKRKTRALCRRPPPDHHRDPSIPAIPQHWSVPVDPAAVGFGLVLSGGGGGGRRRERFLFLLGFFFVAFGCCDPCGARVPAGVGEGRWIWSRSTRSSPRSTARSATSSAHCSKLRIFSAVF